MGIEKSLFSRVLYLALFPTAFFIQDKTLNPISGLRHYYDDIYELSALRDPRVNLNFLFFFVVLSFFSVTIMIISNHFQSIWPCFRIGRFSHHVHSINFLNRWPFMSIFIALPDIFPCDDNLETITTNIPGLLNSWWLSRPLCTYWLAIIGFDNNWLNVSVCQILLFFQRFDMKAAGRGIPFQFFNVI